MFLETQFGPSIVKDIWNRTVSESFEMDAIGKAIAARGSTFEDQWRKFIAFCWNQNTINDATRLYQATKVNFTTAPDDPTQDIEADLSLSLANGFAAVKHEVNLPHASMAFYRVKFAGSDSRSVTFINGLNYGLDTFDDGGVGKALRFTGLQPSQREGVSMQLYLKVNGAWQSAPVDVTNVPWIAICRDNPAGRVDEVVFMYGNAEIDRGDANYEALQVPGVVGPGLIATDIGCRDWTARLDMKRPVDVGTGVETFTLKNVTLTNAFSTAAPQPGGPKPPYGLAPGEQVQPGFGFIYKATGGTAEWTYNQHIGGSTTCDYAGGKTYSVTGGAAVGAIPVLTLSNYTPPGNASRSLITVGLAINALGRFRRPGGRLAVRRRGRQGNHRHRHRHRHPDGPHDPRAEPGAGERRWPADHRYGRADSRGRKRREGDRDVDADSRPVSDAATREPAIKLSAEPASSPGSS